MAGVALQAARVEATHESAPGVVERALQVAGLVDHDESAAERHDAPRAPGADGGTPHGDSRQQRGDGPHGGLERGGQFGRRRFRGHAGIVGAADLPAQGAPGAGPALDDTLDYIALLNLRGSDSM